MRLTDVANAETLLRLVQSVPSPKAEPIKLWLAKVGYERMQEMSDPALERARADDRILKAARTITDLCNLLKICVYPRLSVVPILLLG